jgi:hypothetical protein
MEEKKHVRQNPKEAFNEPIVTYYQNHWKEEIYGIDNWAQ